MGYSFETKRTKAFIQNINIDVEDKIKYILPTKFPLNIETINKDMLREYTIVNNKLTFIEIKLGRPAIIMLAYIKCDILQCSNFIKISEKDYCIFSGYKRDSFYEAVEELVKHQVISNTVRKSIYVVNHNLIFRGNIIEFVNVYNIKYGTYAKVDTNGKVLIER